MAFEGFFDYPDAFLSDELDRATLGETKTKDGLNLSIKQIRCLMNGFKDNKGYDTQKFIKEHTYKECSDKIGYFINQWKIENKIDDNDDYVDAYIYDCIVP